MNIVMIAVHKQGNKIIGFRVLDTDNKIVKDVPYDNMKAVLESGQVSVENIELDNGRLSGANGAFSRYPLIVNGSLYGKSPIVILFELVDNCYRVTNYTGEIVDMQESEVIRYAISEGIANGKLIKDDRDSYYISSISGTYKKDKLITDKQYGAKLAAKMKMLGKSAYHIDENGYMKLKDLDVEELVVGKGVVGIVKGGCANAKKLKSITLPQTLDSLSESAFMLCESLEEITIPEGVKEIPKSCFAGCKNLKVVNLPNSMRKIDRMAFYNCRSLKLINCGREKIEIAFGAIPNGVRRVKR